MRSCTAPRPAASPQPASAPPPPSKPPLPDHRQHVALGAPGVSLHALPAGLVDPGGGPCVSCKQGPRALACPRCRAALFCSRKCKKGGLYKHYSRGYCAAGPPENGSAEAALREREEREQAAGAGGSEEGG